MNAPSNQSKQLNIEQVVRDILNTIEKIREREILSKRFGLFARKETLEQIGELLQITRERVRQLEKSTLASLKYNPHQQLPHMDKIENLFSKYLKEAGNILRVKDLGAKFSKNNDHINQSRILFLGSLSPKFTIIKNDYNHHASICLADIHDSHEHVKAHVDSIIKHISAANEPVTPSQIQTALKHSSIQHIHALATISKKLSFLRTHWGLIHWSSVNPKNIQSKIFIILRDANQPLHFAKIAKLMKDSSFSKNNVTVQAIHNALIKDNRFVLCGRGIYALKEWGYTSGTVADVIQGILAKSGKPLSREEIVKKVLKQRQVKQTTILLNLQCKPIFKRLKDGKYILNK